MDYVLRGNEFVQQQAYDLALEAYNKAIEFQPVPEAFCNRGYVFHEKSEYDRALEDANRAIALKPDFAQAFCNRGAAYSEKGDVGRAIQDYGKAINLEPNLALAFNNRGHAFLLAGRSDLAIVDCNRAVELKPDLALLLEIAARRHFASGALSKRQGTSRMQSGSIRRIAATFVGFTFANARAGQADPVRFHQDAANLNLAEWPGATIAFLLGSLTPDDLPAISWLEIEISFQIV